MGHSIPKIVAVVIGIPIALAVAILLAPLIALAWLGHVVASAWLASRLRAAWPANKFVLLGYTQSPVWAPFIEDSLMSQLGDSVVSIDRSEEGWKRNYPIEARALSFWGGIRSYNPIAVVIRSRWRVRVFRFYKAFQQKKHGSHASSRLWWQNFYRTSMRYSVPEPSRKRARYRVRR